MSKKDFGAAAATPLAGLGGIDTHGDDEMTPEQAAKLRALAEKADEPFDGNLTRREAEKRIAALEEMAD